MQVPMDVMMKNSSIKTAEEQAKIVKVDFGYSISSKEFIVTTVRAIRECPGMKTLHLEGKGIDLIVALAISSLLEAQSSLENIILRSIFGTMYETEIIQILTCMAKGIVRTNAKLVKFELMDNAIGPFAIGALKDLFESPCCFTLQELNLSNNCLGYIGVQLITTYMLKCIENGLKAGTPMKLKVFEYSNNLLGDKGVSFISKFLEKLGTLKSIDLSRNYIGYNGMVELSVALYSNPLLVKLVLDDNKLTEFGVIHLARCLQSLKKLQILSLRRCFLTSKDVRLLAASLENNCPSVRRIDLSFNDISKGFDDLLDVMEKKIDFEDLDMSYNRVLPEEELSLQCRLWKLKRMKQILRLQSHRTDG